MARVELPALIDCHVHFREPGLEYKGDMQSEAAAAYAGGINVVCDMPNTQPPTQTIEAFADKVLRASRVKSRCDMRFFFGATAHEHIEQLELMWTQPQHAELRRRCAGLKLYLDNSTGNMKSSGEVVEAAFALCGRLGIPLVAHCEHAEHNEAASAAHAYTGPASHSRRRPAESEVASISQAIELAGRYSTQLHIAHLSTAGGVECLRRARAASAAGKKGVPRITAEVTPHHLFLTEGDYCGCGSRVKVNPPVRQWSDVEQLWEAVLDGTVDCIATDHAPHTLQDKSDESNPPSGMPSIELVVPLLLTVCAGRWPHPTTSMPKALQERKLTVDDIVRLMHTNPNRIFGLDVTEEKKRTFDTSVEWVVEESQLHSKCKWSPYANWKLVGKVM
ncbi:dihydroorotase, putative [Trypanosoma equiperdum]|uniref:Dihydroorotase, putative n=2 Tax=Trypanozoon TaxID=39700 RepID=Q57X19_TRYB2|nr:dihydroorotase, putative [Trypanosoma brucei brucei TREU927]AAX69848.1 dihydroorotase, putative [Trypanosoma brucei]AAZ13327.1 dihydroorotase, putative [Trypanosoma brucei brucei TREU927]SCU67200.1 dihydroorotase, putative [Trypanosoma equiperdum]